MLPLNFLAAQDWLPTLHKLSLHSGDDDGGVLRRLFTGSSFVVIGIDVLFILIYVASAVRKRHSLQRTRSLVKSASAFNLVLAACIYLLLLNLGAALWLPFRAWRVHLPLHKSSLIVEAVVQVATWAVASLALVSARRSGEEKLPSMLRIWWVMSFLLNLFVVTLGIILLLSKSPLSLDVWIGVGSLPASIVLLIASFRGRMGISYMYSNGLEDPLLNGNSDKAREEVTLYSTAGVLSLATISWISPLLALGAKRPLEPEDLPHLAQKDCATATYGTLHERWQKAKEASKTPSLVRSIAESFWKQAALNGIFVVINTCASYVGPYLIEDFVEYLGGTERFAHEGLILGLVFMGTKVIENLTQRQWFLGVQILGMHVRSALTACVYRKGLRLSNPSRQSRTSGDIVNYMAVDIERVTDFTWYMHDIWMLPLQITLALLILYKNVGAATLATVVATIATIACNTPLARMQEKYQDKIMEAKDERMRATTECLRSMKILKLQAWEKAYLYKLQNLRKVEYGWLKKSFYAQAAVTYIFWATPVLVAVITFGTCVVLKIPLTAGRVLSSLATFRVLQEPLNNFPDFISTLAQTRVSLDRLTTYLHEQELQDDAIIRVPKAVDDDMAIEVEGGEFSWDGSPEKLTLSAINLHVKQGMTVAVCGMVGSGKSTLLSCLLGEIPKLAGTVKVKGATAYVGQTAWIQSGKIEDNVLFGSPMDRGKYDSVLERCQLTKDLEVLPYGDQTEIGERGINLSGGQKQRIQLARAVYQDADIYLLDDPFSAVDVQTGTQIFKECVLGALASKTIVLVTHQVEFLPVADLILVLKDGCIVQSGTYNELLGDGTDFSALVGAHNKAMEVIDQAEKASGTLALGSIEEVLDDDDEKAGNKLQSKQGENQVKSQLVQEEERERGSVGLDVYWTYCTAVYKGALVPLILAAQLFFQLFQIGGNWWMAQETPTTSTEKASVSPTVLILVYAALTLGGSLFVLLRVVLMFIVGLATAQKFFHNMLHCIFHAPMSFFDSTPAGRILNRVCMMLFIGCIEIVTATLFINQASTDQSALDLDIPYRLGGLAFSTIQLLCIAGVMSQAIWQVFIVFVPVFVFCVYLQRYYISSGRELSRLQGIQKAPIIHHFAESIAGAPTIRGFNQEDRFVKRNLILIDNFARCVFYSAGAMEWVALRLELLTNLVFSFCLILLVCLPRGSIDPSLAGLAVTYGLNLNVIQAWMVWNLCNVERKIISVERVQQYTRIPSEAPWEVEESKPPQSWPCEGNVDLVNLQIRYNVNSPLVLHGVSCAFPGGKKVGVVGRTGSGKSTLIQAIFRIIEPAGGKILIDGVDITGIGLHDLRSRLSIIPQDPTLFEGTIRYNLDPLGQHSDSEIWEALDKCELGDLVRSKDVKLEATVSENGENWSVGQRQLFCLGRVMLKRARVLVLDEATASVDTATDGVLQSTISKEFKGCTVITIAHRLPTVIDSDLVLVLSDGRIAEYDEPAKLLEKNSSHFFKLVSEYSKRSFGISGSS